MKIFFELRCQKCGELHEVYCTPDELKKVLKENKCTKCSGSLERVWDFGYGKLKGSGFTRKGGIV